MMTQQKTIKTMHDGEYQFFKNCSSQKKKRINLKITPGEILILITPGEFLILITPGDFINF